MMIMIFLNFAILLLKFILYITLSHFNIAVLIYINIILSLIIFTLIKIPKPRTEFLEIIYLYRIKNIYSLIYSMFRILTYGLVIFGGIFLLRIYNSKNPINLILVKEQIKLNLELVPYPLLLLTILASILLLIAYILLLSKLFKNFNEHFVKCYLYFLYRYNFDNYTAWTYFSYIDNYTIDHLCTSFKLKCEKYFYPQKMPYVENFEHNLQRIPKNIQTIFDAAENVLCFIFNYIHYGILICTFFYDLIFHNYVLSYTFAILPLIFIYDLYKRFTYYISYLSFNDDQKLSDFLYEPHISVTEYEIQIIKDSSTIELPYLYYLVTIYLKNNLNGYMWNKPIKGETSLKEKLNTEGAFKIPDKYDTKETQKQNKFILELMKEIQKINRMNSL